MAFNEARVQYNKNDSKKMYLSIRNIIEMISLYSKCNNPFK